MSAELEELSGEIVLEIARERSFNLPELDNRWLFYQSDPEKPETVVLLSPDTPPVLILNGGNCERRIGVSGMAAGYFLTADKHAFSQLVALRPDDKVRAERAKIFLASKGARVARSNDDARQLAKAFYLAERGSAGSRSDRAAAWTKIDRDHEVRFAEALTTKWLECVQSNELVPADILIFRAAAARDSSKPDIAVECCRRAHVIRSRYQKSDLAVLATEGAAALLDICEQSRDPQLASEAEEFLRYAWAVSPNEFASAVYRRLRRLEAALTDEAASQHRFAMREKLTDAENRLSHPNSELPI
ncbi:hypothetical protein ACFO0A_03750 [Novosphingobium tardum]|uniref:Uncharacterized protein n=1 Tax=Novosphingobium tardum TaxID=1538021 RepID=A0ABV8RMS8_9SPHN